MKHPFRCWNTRWPCGEGHVDALQLAAGPRTRHSFEYTYLQTRASTVVQHNIKPHVIVTRSEYRNHSSLSRCQPSTVRRNKTRATCGIGPALVLTRKMTTDTRRAGKQRERSWETALQDPTAGVLTSTTDNTVVLFNGKERYATVVIKRLKKGITGAP